MSNTLVRHNLRSTRKGCKYCDAAPLYWYHETGVSSDAKGLKECKTCELPATTWVLLDENGNPHNCRNFKSAEEVARLKSLPRVERKETRKSGTGDRTETVPPVKDDATPVTTDALSGVTMGDVKSVISAMVADAIADVKMPTRIVVEKADGTKREIEGITHKRTPDVMGMIMAGLNVMMVGPAGTGKSHFGIIASEAMGLPHYSISLSPQTTAVALLGYMNATGDYVRTDFREAFENGGVFMFDEIDNGHPSILAAMNSALANKRLGFPDGQIKAHPDFRCLASANTYGRGADRMYVGRSQLDAATLDRFAMITIDYDEILEEAICLSLATPETVTKVLNTVRTVRKNVTDNRMPIVVSTRMAMDMCKMITQGLSWSLAVETRVRRGASDADWAKMRAGI